MNKVFNLREARREQKPLYHFFKNVMMVLGHYGWALDLKDGHDSYCWINQKRIDIGIEYNGDPRQILLHEIAHIDTAKYCNQKHNPQFWKRLEYLMRRFLRTGLDEIQLKHKEWCSKGIYRMVYGGRQKDRMFFSEVDWRL